MSNSFTASDVAGSSRSSGNSNSHIAAAAAAAATNTKNLLRKNNHTEWPSKEITLDDVGTKIPNGSSVYIASCAATAEATLTAMTDDYKLANIQIVQMIPGGNLPHLYESIDRFRTTSFYAFQKTAYRQQRQGDGSSSSSNRWEETLQDYTPVSIFSVPRLLDEGKLKCDVAIIKVTRPHKQFVSLGMGVEMTKAFIRHAHTVIAEVNEHMPWTEGQSKVHISEIDYWIRNDQRLMTTSELWPDFMKRPTWSDEILDNIGRNVVKLIPDRATVKFGVSPLTFCVLPHLRQRQDLGLHTDLFTETLKDLHEEGVITNAYKTIDTGRSICSQAHGSQSLYDFLDRNPIIEFYSASYVDDPQVMAKIDNLVSVIGGLKIDLTAQVATDSISHKFYGGVWSDMETLLGAKLSKGGKPVVIIPSLSLHGRSNIVFALPPGTGVTISRADVEYVVTEHGIAYLYGKSIRERSLALIDIAHPDFRAELLEQAKATGYVSASQPGRFSVVSYPADLECLHAVCMKSFQSLQFSSSRDWYHNLLFLPHAPSLIFKICFFLLSADKDRKTSFGSTH